VLVHNKNPLAKTINFSGHAITRMAESKIAGNEITKKMVEKGIEKGTKYWNFTNGTYNYILENGFASGKHFLVGQNSINGYITTVGRYRNIPKYLIRLKN